MRTGGATQLLSIGLAGLVVVGTGGPALAEHDGWPHGKVESVVPAEGGIDVSFAGTGVPEGTELRPEDLSVYLGGEKVAASSIALEDEKRPAALARRAILVVDTSGSMSGEPLEAARRAAMAYLEQVPAEVEVGLVTFSQSPTVAVAPTLDRDPVVDEIRRLTAQGETSLYDAVVAASAALGSEGDRRVLVLSDGEDTASRASLDAAETDLARSGVTMDAVVLGEVPAATAALRSLADVARGRTLQANDSAALAAAFESVAHDFEPRLVIHVPVPPALAGQSSTLRIEVGSNHGLLVDEAPVVLRAGATDSGSSGGTAWAAFGVLLVALIALLVIGRRAHNDPESKRNRVAHLLSTYTLHRGAGDASTAEPVKRIGAVGLEQALEQTERLLKWRGLNERVSLRLDRAAVKLTAPEWVFVHAGLTLVTMLALGLVAGWLAGLLAATVMAFAANAWLGFKAKRRLGAFTDEMPDALQLVASGLSSGYSLPQALDSVVREGREPVASEFGRALAEARLGVPLEDALETVAGRMDSEDFRWVVMAIRVQREVGGNLAEVLTTLCQTMRDRASLRRQVKALSAEGRLSTYVMIAIPPALAAYMALTAPEFWSVMWEEPVGIGLLVASTIALALGYAWMTKLAKVEM